MDPVLKQRLVGAVVITALAAIFLPMLFDDPVEDAGRSISELSIPEAPQGQFASSIKAIPENAQQVLELPPAEPLKVEQDGVSAKHQQNKAKQHPSAQQPQLVRWVIQVGSFSQKENALLLRNKLRKQGFSAFVEKIWSEEQVKMYRLRVGPELDKSRAEVMKAKLEQKNNIKSILISE